MVAASKIRRHNRSWQPRPYAERIRTVASAICNDANPEYKHPFMEKARKVKRVGYIVVSTDRGLCGGLNVNACSQNAGELKEMGRTRARRSIL